MEKTEIQIKQAAKEIFFSKGRLNAKMHEIAKHAGVNRALLHYYFRNRETLFETVLQEAMDESFFRMFEILSSSKPFEKRITEAIDHIIDCLIKYPFIESFIISELNKHPGNKFSVQTINSGRDFTSAFLKEIRLFLKKQKKNPVRAEDFLVNMMALCAYASSTKPLIQTFLGYSEKEYARFLKARKKSVAAIVLMKM